MSFNRFLILNCYIIIVLFIFLLYIIYHYGFLCSVKTIMILMCDYDVWCVIYKIISLYLSFFWNCHSRELSVSY